MEYITKETAIKAIQGLCIERNTPQMIWSTDAMDAVRNAPVAWNSEEEAPRLMTIEEVRQSNGIIYLETNEEYTRDHKPRCETAMIAAETDHETLIFELPKKNGRTTQTSACFYGWVIRCWTAKPTDKQREAVKWDE